MAEIATADQEPTANVGAIKARRQRKRKMAQCRFCGWMLLATNLKQHAITWPEGPSDRALEINKLTRNCCNHDEEPVEGRKKRERDGCIGWPKRQ